MLALNLISRGIVPWLLEPGNAAKVAALSFSIGIFGTLLTILGFGITIWQILRTVSASKAIALAVDGIKSKVAVYDAVFDLSRVAAALEESKRHIQNENWVNVQESYWSAKNGLIRLTESPSAITPGQKLDLEGILSEISHAHDKLHGVLYKGTRPTDVTKSLVSMSKYHETVTRISLYLERSL